MQKGRALISTNKDSGSKGAAFVMSPTRTPVRSSRGSAIKLMTPLSPLASHRLTSNQHKNE